MFARIKQTILEEAYKNWEAKCPHCQQVIKPVRVQKSCKHFKRFHLDLALLEKWFVSLVFKISSTALLFFFPFGKFQQASVLSAEEGTELSFSSMATPGFTIALVIFALTGALLVLNRAKHAHGVAGKHIKLKRKARN